MTTTRRALSSLAVLALAAGLMVGCSDKDDPSPSAGSEATATTPVETSDGGGAGEEPTKPDVPKPDPKDYPGMDEHTDDGAEQAFKYFWALIIWGHETGVSDPLDGTYSADCDLCARLSADIDKIEKNQTQWSGASIEDIKLYSDADAGDHEYVVSYQFYISEHDEPLSGNPKKHPVKKAVYSAVGGMDWSEGSWVVKIADSDVESVE